MTIFEDLINPYWLGAKPPDAQGEKAVAAQA
jgi:hypothetical protein